MSPEVGRLDEAHSSELIDEDPDAAVALLTDLAVATDPALRAPARRVAARVFMRMAARGAPPGAGACAGWRPSARATATSTSTARWSAAAGGGPRRGEDLVVRRWARGAALRLPAGRPQRLDEGRGGGDGGAWPPRPS